MIYLASASPRRASLLKKAGIPFKVMRTDYPEDHHPKDRPSLTVKKHALGKASAAAEKIKSGKILAADTIVHFRGSIIGKPPTRAAAKKTLLSLQGRWHTVYTGVAFLEKKDGRIRRKHLFYVRTKVLLKKMSPKDVDRYYRRVEPLDKAGGYAIQARGAGIVERVRGSFSNAVGLPMERLAFL